MNEGSAQVPPLLCYILDDVEPVYREDKGHYRRSGDKRAKPATLEREHLLVVFH